MQIINGKAGWIEVICGPMFSGKSEELIKRLRRAQIARRRVRVARAGHPPPMLYRAADGEATEARVPGVMVLGFDDFGEVPVTAIDLAPGDLVLAYTDGLTERFSLNDAIYGEERLLTVLQQHAADTPERLCEAVMADLSRFAEGRPADDDQAFVAFKLV